MKILILSATTGGGHMTAANALCDYLTQKGEITKVIDTLESISPFLNKTVTEVYEHLAKHMPKFYKIIYNSSNKKAGNKFVYLIMKFIAKKILPEIEKFKPDIIITTHPFPTEMSANLKKHKKINIPIICIMTDYAPHRTWLNSYIDHYIVANDKMIEPMTEMGIKKEKIHNFGIPINDFFHEKKDKKSLIKYLGLEPNLPAVLIMAGSLGIGNILTVYEDLQEIKPDFQIIIITGKNEKLYKKILDIIGGKQRKKFKILPGISNLSKILKKTKPWRLKKRRIQRFVKLAFSSSKKQITKPTHIVYFTKEVDKYMSVCDFIITKPGGLTVTEALACKLPIAVFNPIPGQEEENADFLINNNMAVELKKGKDGIKTIEKLLKNTKVLEDMKENLENFDTSNCLENIYKLMKEKS